MLPSRFIKPFFILRFTLWGLLMLVQNTFLSAQDIKYFPVQNIQVNSAGDALLYPFTGGFAMPQFNSIDLDKDGQADLLVFDRIGEQVLPFLSHSINSQARYIYAPQYAEVFPPLFNFAHFVDFDGDGLVDIFTTNKQTASVAVLKIYQQRFVSGQIHFVPITYLLNDSVGALVEMHAFDIPALKDINGDGDLDLLHFPRFGETIHYFENQSIESGYGLDSLHFLLYEDCWGGMEYTLNGLELNACPGLHGGNGDDRAYCSGSTLLALDYDNDGDQDLLYSGLTDDSLSLLQNGGTNEAAEVININKAFLLEELEALTNFPAPFWLDLNADGLLDLAISSNRVAAVLNGSTSDQFFFFENVASNKNPTFELRSQTFLVDQTIDHGFRSSPASFDYNADGLPDLIVAANVADPFFSFRTQLNLYENIGTPSEPAFQLITEDYLGLSQYQLKVAHPTFGDLDEDGDTDLLLGEKNGQLYYFENKAANGQAADFHYQANLFDTIDVGTYSRPQIIDLDQDGLKDIIIGSWNGDISYFRNSIGNGAMQFEWITDQLGNIYADTFGIESAPLIIDLPGQADLQMLNATRDGKVELYTQLNGNLAGSWILEALHFSNIQLGSSPTISAADLNADGIPELLFGNERGGINIYMAEEELVGMNAHSAEKSSFSAKIYPNPAQNQLNIELDIINPAPVELTLINQFGQNSYHTQIIPTDPFQQISIGHLAPGYYICRLKMAKQQKMIPIVVY